MKKITQKGLILSHLEKCGSITQWEATTKYHCIRLGARIYELRRLGHNIRTEREGCVNQITGNHSEYAKYILE